MSDNSPAYKRSVEVVLASDPPYFPGLLQRRLHLGYYTAHWHLQRMVDEGLIEEAEDVIDHAAVPNTDEGYQLYGNKVDTAGFIAGRLNLAKTTSPYPFYHWANDAWQHGFNRGLLADTPH